MVDNGELNWQKILGMRNKRIFLYYMNTQSTFNIYLYRKSIDKDHWITQSIFEQFIIKQLGGKSQDDHEKSTLSWIQKKIAQDQGFYQALQHHTKKDLLLKAHYCILMSDNLKAALKGEDKQNQVGKQVTQLVPNLFFGDKKSKAESIKQLTELLNNGGYFFDNRFENDKDVKDNLHNYFQKSKASINKTEAPKYLAQIKSYVIQVIKEIISDASNEQE